jgi:hypothetical protein
VINKFQTIITFIGSFLDPSNKRFLLPGVALGVIGGSPLRGSRGDGAGFGEFVGESENTSGLITFFETPTFGVGENIFIINYRMLGSSFKFIDHSYWRQITKRFSRKFQKNIITNFFYFFCLLFFNISSSPTYLRPTAVFLSFRRVCSRIE